ncbi:MAG: Uma2 family endonuclease [Acidobacteriaceae bacterium]
MRALLPIDAETPRSLVINPPLTDSEFEAICLGSEWFRYERTREGEILMHPPAGGFTGRGNAEITAQLHSWWRAHRRGSVFDSSTGFFLPDRSILNPDAAFVLPHKLKGLQKDDLTGFPRLCPDFVIELISSSDSLPKAQEKMDRWLENGAALGWLIEPYQRQVYVHEPKCETRIVSGPEIRGKGPVEGFILDLEELWRCYEV